VNCGRGSVFAIVSGLFFFLRILVSLLLVGYGYGQGIIELCLVSYVLYVLLSFCLEMIGSVKLNFIVMGFLSVTSSNAFTFRAFFTQSCFAVFVISIYQPRVHKNSALLISFS
jgi:hypothetical protein